jgi:hypothetical protein
MTENARVTLYHPSGAKIEIPVSPERAIQSQEAEIIFNSVNSLLSAGFSVDIPGDNDGELVDEAFAVARRMSNDNVNIVAFYKSHPKLNKKFIHEYLDTPEQVKEFESATGLKLERLPLFDGDKDITKDHRSAAQYIVKLPRPVKIVYCISERWKSWNETDKHDSQPQKYDLIRYILPVTHATPAVPPTQVIPPAMNYEQARAVKSPNGAELGTLDAEKLSMIHNSRAANVTAEMRNAAEIILKEQKLEGA